MNSPQQPDIHANVAYCIEEYLDHGKHLSRVVRVLDNEEPKDLKKIFRDHKKKGIEIERELTIREDLDQTLDFCARLELIALEGEIGPADIAHLTNIGLLRTLTNPAIQAYYEKIYPTRLATLLRLRLEGKKQAVQRVSTQPGERDIVANLLSLFDYFLRNEEMAAFCKLIEDFAVCGIAPWEGEFEKECRKIVKKNPLKFSEIMSEHDGLGFLIRGGLQLVDFYSNLASVISRTENRMLRCYGINLFSYWLERSEVNYDLAIKPLLSVVQSKNFSAMLMQAAASANLDQFEPGSTTDNIQNGIQRFRTHTKTILTHPDRNYIPDIAAFLTPKPDRKKLSRKKLITKLKAIAAVKKVAAKLPAKRAFSVPAAKAQPTKARHAKALVAKAKTAKARSKK